MGSPIQRSDCKLKGLLICHGLGQVACLIHIVSLWLHAFFFCNKELEQILRFTLAIILLLPFKKNNGLVQGSRHFLQRFSLIPTSPPQMHLFWRAFHGTILTKNSACLSLFLLDYDSFPLFNWHVLSSEPNSTLNVSYYITKYIVLYTPFVKWIKD